MAKKQTTKIFSADFPVCLYELLILLITNIDNDSSDENYKYVMIYSEHVNPSRK
jgi:hypothetical protein